jgi:hypothetical protein
MSEVETETKTISYKHPTRTTKGVHVRKEPKGFEYNNLDVKAYKDIDIEVPETVGRWERRFLSNVDVSKGPIERSVVAMVRLKAPDYLGQENQKDKDKDKTTKLPERKEFLYYAERWEGKDWRGIPLNPVSEHIEGKWTKQFTRPHFNYQTGEIDYYQLDPGKATKIYTIPFSKKAVEDIIAKSANTTKDNGITFTVRFASEDNPVGAHEQFANRNQFTAEQFINWSWDQLCKFNYKPSVQKYEEYLAKEKAKDGLSFEPT